MNETKLSYKIFIKKRINHFKNIYETNVFERDKIFMKNYKNLLPNLKLIDYDNAIERLNSKKFIKLFIEELKINKIDCLIGGSYGLFCTFKYTRFDPNDIDLYLKNINRGKLLCIENILKKILPTEKMIVWRKPLTMNWHFENFINVQINLMDINQWSEVFITYHSDLTCIGYEVLTSQFLYLENRFENILINKSHEFCNILNLDNKTNLYDAYDKYQDRGFKTLLLNEDTISIQKKVKNLYSIIETFSLSGAFSNPIESNKFEDFLLEILFTNYIKNNKIYYSTSVFDLYDNYTFIPPIKYISIYLIRENDINLELVKNYFNECQNIIFKRGFLLTNEIKSNKVFSHIILKDKFNKNIFSFDEISNYSFNYMDDVATKLGWIKRKNDSEFCANINKYKAIYDNYKLKLFENNFPTLYQLCCMKTKLYIDDGIIKQII